MNRRVTWSDRALRELRLVGRSDAQTAQRIARAVSRFAESGEGDVKKLRGSPGDSRLRVGDWRVLFIAYDGEIVVSRVVNRRDAYRD